MKSSVHEGKKPFSCKICDVRFTQSGILNGHISAVHEVNKRFKCNICDASFSQKGSLNGHIPSVLETDLECQYGDRDPCRSCC